MVEHKTIKLPIELLNEVEKFIQDNPRLGYTSSAEYVKEKIRNALKEESRRKD